MFCPRCGNADQEPETYCRQCGDFLPDFDKLKKRETPPEQHLKVNSVLTLMSAVVSGTLAILLHAFFTGGEHTHPLIYITAGFLTAMFFWQVQTFWRTRLVKKQLLKKRKKAKPTVEGLDTNPLLESANATEVLSELGLGSAAPRSAVENRTRM